MALNDDLRRKAEEAFDLSYLDELKLWLAYRVIQRKVLSHMPPKTNLSVTILGLAAAFLNYLLVPLQTGTPIPQSGHDWAMLGLSAAIAMLGAYAKGAGVGSQPGDPPTPQRVVGALAAGKDVDPVAAAKSVDAIKVTAEVGSVVDPSLDPTHPPGM